MGSTEGQPIQESAYRGQIITGDAFEVVPRLPVDSVDCVVTSPPYWGLRDYLIDDQLGIEDKASNYVEKVATIASDLIDAVDEDGSLWLNVGDTYNGNSPIRQKRAMGVSKGDDEYEQQLAEGEGTVRRSVDQFDLPRRSLLQIPDRIAMAVQQEGWILRDRVIWHKSNPKPEGRATSRLTQAHETVFRFVQSEGATFHRDRLPDTTNVWTVYMAGDTDHPAPMPAEIPRRCIRATTDPGDTVLDPFCGSGTVCEVADQLNREYVGIELNQTFADRARNRIDGDPSHGLSRWVDS